MLPGCGEGDGSRGGGGVLDCVRDLGAKVEKRRLYSFPGAAIESYQLTLRAGSFAGVEVFRNDGEAQARLGTGPVAVRKGRAVVLYPGSSEAEADQLEGCLRSSVAGPGLSRGELARKVARMNARAKEVIKRQRNRSFSGPQVGGALRSLRSYRRFTVYYPGTAASRLPLTGLHSGLVPPAYENKPRRIPPPISPRFSFIYGSCKPPPGSEGGCSPPLQIQNSEVCAVNPNSYGLRPRALTKRIRGVPVLSKERGRSLELFTRDTTITVSADSWDVAARAIANLRSLDGRIGPRTKLPVPRPAALKGQLRCKRPTKTELDATP